MKQFLHFRFHPKAFNSMLGAVLVVFLSITSVSAQTNYIYRSKQSGLWNDLLTWERAHISTPASFVPLQGTDPVPSRYAEQIFIYHTVTVNLTNISATKLEVTSGATLEISSGKKITVYDGAGSNDLLVSAGGTIVNNSGTVALDITGSPAISFAANSLYKHNYITDFGQIPLATWDINSTIEFTGYTGLSTTPPVAADGFGQSFGNVRWNTANNTGNLNLLGALTTIRGNFDIVSTGQTASDALIMSSNGNYTLTIGKNLNMQNQSLLVISPIPGGTYVPGNFTLNLTGSLNISSTAFFRHNNATDKLKINFLGTGNLACSNTSSNNANNMNYEVAPAATIILSNDMALGASASFTVNGKLELGDKIISGSGSFTVANNSTIAIGSADGIASSGAKGNIRTTTRNFASGVYLYNGTIPQVTGNGLPSQINELTIENPNGLTLSAPVTISSKLKMTEGVITTNSVNKITIASSGSVVMPAANKTSFVNGPIAYTVDVTNFDNMLTFNYPVGKNGKYRPIELNVYQFDPTTTTYTAEQFDQNYTYPVTDALPGSIENISKVRFFRIEKSTGAEVTARIKLTYGSDDGVSDYQDLTIMKYNATNKWVDIIGTATGNGSGTIISDYFDNFSDFILGNKFGNNPLPVEFVNFTAKAQNKAVVLNWETASEKNSSHFEIERTADARNFERIGTANSAGNSQTLKRYAFEDKNPLAGVTYYRLKQVDLDGTVAYSKVVQVSGNLNHEIRLFPNPVSDHLMLELPAAASVSIVNALGQVVYKGNAHQAAGMKIDANALPAGIYQVVVKTSQKTIVNKFVKAVF